MKLLTHQSAATWNVGQTQNVELIRDHWLNGNRYVPGVVLCLPTSCAANMIEAGAARSVPVPSNDSAQKGN